MERNLSKQLEPKAGSRDVSVGPGAGGGQAGVGVSVMVSDHGKIFFLQRPGLP